MSIVVNKFGGFGYNLYLCTKYKNYMEFSVISFIESLTKKAEELGFDMSAMSHAIDECLGEQELVLCDGHV